MASNTCSHCGKANAIDRCSACKIVYYCSRKCQIKHWKSGHKKQCTFESIQETHGNVAQKQNIKLQEKLEKEFGIGKAIPLHNSLLKHSKFIQFTNKYSVFDEKVATIIYSHLTGYIKTFQIPIEFGQSSTESKTPENESTNEFSNKSINTKNSNQSKTIPIDYYYDDQNHLLTKMRTKYKSTDAMELSRAIYDNQTDKKQADEYLRILIECGKNDLLCPFDWLNSCESYSINIYRNFNKLNANELIDSINISIKFFINRSKLSNEENEKIMDWEAIKFEIPQIAEQSDFVFQIGQFRSNDIIPTLKNPRQFAYLLKLLFDNLKLPHEINTNPRFAKLGFSHSIRNDNQWRKQFLSGLRDILNNNNIQPNEIYSGYHTKKTPWERYQQHLKNVERRNED